MSTSPDTTRSRSPLTSDPDAADDHPHVVIQPTASTRVVLSDQLGTARWLIQKKGAVSETDRTEVWRTRGKPFTDRAGLYTTLSAMLGQAFSEADRRAIIALPDYCVRPVSRGAAAGRV